MENMNLIRADRLGRIQGASLRLGEKNYPVFKGINTVGRNKVAIINIKHLNVSQNQAIIILVDDHQHFISDLNSSNGTYLYGSELVPFKLYELTDKAEIKFGDVTGTYSKITNKNSTLNMTESSEMTQDMTQNFYACNTQLIFNQTTANKSNDHSYFDPLQKDKELSATIPDDIHEMETQVVLYPPPQPFQREDKNSDLQPLQPVMEECVVEEAVDSDIHDAPTQVVDFSDKKVIDNSLSNNSWVSASTVDHKSVQMKPSPKEPEKYSFSVAVPSVTEQKNPEAVSQKSASDEATQILSEEKNQQYIEQTNSEATQILNEEESQNALEKLNLSILNDLQIKTQKRNVIHSSQVPCSSGLNKNATFEDEDSFLEVTKNISNLQEDIEETVIEESLSNDSVDFLNMQKHNESGKENINDEEKKLESCEASTLEKSDDNSSSSEIIKTIKNPIPKLPSSITDQEKINTDSDTDIEDSEDKTKNKQTKNYKTLIKSSRVSTRKPLNRLNSDSETDIDSSEEIGIKKKPLRKLNSEEDLTQPEKSSDSETDCEEEIKSRDKPEWKTKKLIPDTDMELGNHKSPDHLEDLNDTDCIPATQDAFAEAFNYKAQKTQNSCQSSEESFKLGITELLEDCTENKASEEIGTNNKTNDENSEYLNEVRKDAGTEKNFEGVQNIEKSNDSIFANTNEESDKLEEEKRDDHIYILPTQKINHKQPAASDPCTNLSSINEKLNTSDNDDIYAMSTQQLDSQNEIFTGFKAPKAFSFKKKAVYLDSSLTTYLSKNKKDEDIYLISTQKMKESEPAVHSKNDDIYLQATQQLEMAQEIDENDVFLQPTQCMDSENKSKAASSQNNEDEDIYMAATQQMEGDTCKKAITKKYASQISEDQNDVYMQETEMVIEKTEDSAKKTDPIQENPDTPPSISTDVYDLCTQAIDTQSEIPFTEKNIKLPSPDANRPRNPIIQVLDQQSSEEKEKPTSSVTKRTRNLPAGISEIPNKKLRSSRNENFEAKIKSDSSENNVETMSQIEAFVKKPLDIVPLSRKSTKTKEPTNEEKPAERSDNVETLSQIEAFIKKPLEVPKYRKSTKTERKPLVEEHNVPETLSQIEAFVKKTFPKAGEEIKEKTSALGLKKVESRKSDSVSRQDDQSVTRRVSRRRSSNNQEEAEAIVVIEKLDIIKEYDEADDFEDSCKQLSKSKHKQKPLAEVKEDDHLERSHSSEDTSRDQDVKSDVDQSFALLESKTSKVRRQPRKDPVLDGIKVSITSHRRSMGIAETSEKSVREEILPSRKSSRRTTVNNNILPAVSKRKAETITRAKKNSVVVVHDDSDLSDSEVPAKVSRISTKVSRKTRDRSSVDRESIKVPLPPKRSRQSTRNLAVPDDNDKKSVTSDDQLK
ncbi:hypothetical protein JTB14_009201 [Gonioctena quinquepunctata]|nr:hypothetical protein JTB14_009201 [Gonioctena quinquepunctata]